jgi:hypothetical protein
MDAPTAPWVGLVESNAVDNDDWITDHAGDPDLITWTNYTEGTEALIFTKPLMYTVTAIPGNKATPLAGGITYQYRTGTRTYRFLIQAQASSKTLVNYCLTFPMFERHTESSSWKDVYLVWMHATNDHFNFVDGSNNVKDYMRVHSAKLDVIWTQGIAEVYTIRIEGVSTW